MPAGGDSYQLRQDIREMVTFREHDVIHDRPIMNCDLILCRNLLIYFNRELQEEILLKLYECLNPGGFLVLGMSEILVGSSAKKFENVNNRLRIYRRPDKEDALASNAETLSQGQIDRIIKELLGR